MTRIIAGFAGSLSLAVPGSGLRPTSDRVREAIFSALDARDVIRGARVVDLYAGSGALGLEAGSRGASHVTLVEKMSSAVRACRRNAATVLKSSPGGLEVEVSGRAVQAFLGSVTGAWNIAFVDPPYELGEADLERDLELLAPGLADDATVVIERSSRSPEPAWPDGIELDRRKDYGDTTLWWAGRRPRPAGQT